MATIYLIRHAEKPDGTSNGVTETGVPDPDSLIPRGWQRAGALTTLFGSKDRLSAPARIYAAGAGKEKVAKHLKVGSNSARPVETITPLAAKLGVNPVVSYDKGDEQNLVTDVLKEGSPALICWQHEVIPRIAELILGNKGEAPQSWPSDRFDVVWCFQNGGQGWQFSQICQQLLSGDGAAPIQR